MPSGGWNKGLTKETDERVARNAAATSAGLMGVPKSPGHIVANSAGVTEIWKNLEYRTKQIVAHMGDKSWNWQGGIPSLYDLLRHGSKSKQWIKDVFTRDKFICQKCGKTGCCLEAHHIKPFSVIFIENNITTYEEAINCEELWDINNGITLCKDCHEKERILTMKLIKEARKEKLLTI